VFFSEDQQLSLDRIKQITAEAAILGAEILELAGGEPMTRGGIYEIISHARSVGLDVLMVTNGVLIGALETKQLIEAGITAVSISLEGPEPVNDHIRGRGNYQKALGAICNFLRSKTKQPNLKVTVGITLSRYNYRLIVPFAKYLLEEIGVDEITVNPFTPDMLMGENRKPRLQEFNITADSIPDLIAEMNQLREYALTVPDKLPSPGFLSEIPEYFLGKKLVPTGGCQIPSLYCGITANGLIHPCWKYPPIGDLNRSSLREIWGSKNHQEFINRAVARQCKGCLLSCYPENH
ncbi:MAG TPA: radical SAM protein, partial [Bacillota bacterium]|nr:radical SAM protein [Bacillota bacterium]